MRNRIVAGVVLVGALTLVAGCTAAGGGPGDPGDDSTLEVGDGAQAPAVGGLPDGFPSFVVLPDGYAPTQVTEQQFQGKTAYTLQGPADGEPADVAASLEGLYGIEPIVARPPGGTVSISYEGVEDYTISYTVFDEDGSALVVMDVLPIL